MTTVHAAVTAAVTSYSTAGGVWDLTALLVLLPLIGAAVLLLGGRRTDPWGHLLGCALPIGSFVIGLVLFFAMLGRHGAQRAVDQHVFSWVPAGSFHVNINFLVDPLSIVFVLLITGVG